MSAYRGHVPAPVPPRPVDPELDHWARWEREHAAARAESHRRAQRAAWREGVWWGLVIAVALLYVLLIAAYDRALVK